MEHGNLINTLWVLVAALLVFFMNAGFALLEAGLCRAKNTTNILGKNFVVFAIASLAFWGLGYALMFGDGGAGQALVGLSGFFVDGSEPSPAPIPTLAFFFFQLTFAATAASIVSGAVAERIHYSAYMAFAAVLVAVVYPIGGHWVWGGGFLADWGFFDFAGSTVVHSMGGWAALTGAVLLGPRDGKYTKDGRMRALPGHSIALATLGTFILWLGWFGFNPGSQLALDGGTLHIVVTTNLSAAAAILSATLISKWRTGFPDLAMSLNGGLAGLVAVTAGCSVVTPIGAVGIGCLAGALVPFAVRLFDRVRIDDPVGAISVHLVCGVFGTLAVGLFAAPQLRVVDGVQLPYGLLYGGGLGLLGTQLAGVLIFGLFASSVSLALWLGLRRVIGLRVDREQEIEGLDLSEMGMVAYPTELSFGGAFSRPSPVPAPAPASEPEPVAAVETEAAPA
jgi:Amt family ammonium transporter